MKQPFTCTPMTENLPPRQVGDVMWITAPDSAELVQDTVVAVEDVEAEGLFNPLTDEGPFLLCLLWSYSLTRHRFAKQYALV